MFLSIIAPYYDCGPYIYACLKSLQDCLNKIQHLDINVEVIVVDDFNHNDKGALSLLHGAVSAIDHIAFRVVRPEKNLGLAGARNFGKNLAKGKYLFFLDSDDYINPENLAEILHILRVVDTDIIYFDSHSFKNEHTWNDMHKFSFHPRSIQPVTEEVISEYLRDSTFYAWRFIVKAKIMNDIDFKSMYMEDVATTPTILAACKDLWYEPISVVNYRIRPNSIMTSWNPKKITDMVSAPAITKTSLTDRFNDSTILYVENKIMGCRFFYWAIKDARTLNKNMDKDFYLNIKNLYIENFGTFNFRTDLPLLKQIYETHEIIKWLLMYYNWKLFICLVTPANNFKFKALRKKLWALFISFWKITLPILVILLLILNIYNYLNAGHSS